MFFYFRKELSSSKNKKTRSEKLSYISENGTLKPRIKKIIIFYERTLSLKLKKIFILYEFLKNKFAHCSSYYSSSELLQ